MRTAPRRTAQFAAALLIVLAGAVQGCSKTAVPPTPPDGPMHHFARAAELEGAIGTQVLRDGTAATTTTASVGVPGAAEPTRLPPAEGAVSFAVDGRAADAFYPVTFDGSAPALVEAIIVRADTGYLKPPAAMGFKLPKGKPWAGPFQLAENTKGSRDQQMALLATKVAMAADPTYGFGYDLYGEAAAIIGAVDGDLDGVPVVKYSVYVDIAKAAEKQSNKGRKQILQGYLDQGETGADITLWVEAGNRPLRVSTRSGRPPNITTIDIRYRGWGKPVLIDPPPPSETTQ